MITRRGLLAAALLQRIRGTTLARLASLGSLPAGISLSRDSAATELHGVRSSVAVGSAPLVLTLDFGSSEIKFAESDGVDVGDYFGEFVHQRCKMVAKGAWRVFFRPDADGSRHEVVVEYGRSTAGPVQHLASGYSATILNGNSSIYTTQVQRHWWGGRWRWQSSPRAIVRTPDTLRVRRWIPNFGPAGLFGKPPVTVALHWDGPMTSLQGVDPIMGNAGDHDQIGYLTEAAADFMIRPADTTLASLRAEGEWIANACIHLRNDDGTILDVAGLGLRYVSNGGTVGDIPEPRHGTEPSFIYPEVAHTYPCATAGWLLTDDPYLLEELQFMVNWSLLQTAWARKPGLLPPSQTRAYAWGLRDTFIAAATTPEQVPAWLLPRSYWTNVLAVNLKYAMQFVDAPARIHALFRAWPRTDMVAGWMSAWLTAVVGMAADMGFNEWKRVFDWSVEQQIAMSNGRSGWNWQTPVPYYWFPNHSRKQFTFLLDPSSDVTVCTSWNDAWTYFASGADGRVGFTMDPAGWDGHSLMRTSTSFAGHLRSALAIAASRGTPGAAACYAHVHEEMAPLLARNRVYGQARFSVDPRTEAIMPVALSATDTAQPEPQLSSLRTLRSGYVRPLGRFADNLPHFHRTDYSCIVADPANRRILFYGGGHAPAIGDGTDDDIRSFDMATLRWSSLYAPTPSSDMTPANEDATLGRWISTNHPIVRHDYNNSIVQGGRYYLFSCNWQLLGPVNPAPICWYDFKTGKWSYSRSGRSPGWYYTAGAAFDPKSGLFIICGTDDHASGWFHLWTYDSAADKVEKIRDFKLVGHMVDMHYDEASDSFLLFHGGGIVWRLVPNRTVWRSSVLTVVKTTGRPPPNSSSPPISFAFDGTRYGGSVIDGAMYVYDSDAAAWSTRSMRYEDGSASMLTQVFYCIEFDPGTGCYIILARDWQTYAYRP